MLTFKNRPILDIVQRTESLKGEEGQKEGEGLRGMRERVEAIGGSVRRDVSTGTRLSIRLPASLVTS